MRKKEFTQEVILKSIEECFLKTGKKPTVREVRAQTGGGQNADISDALKKWDELKAPKIEIPLTVQTLFQSAWNEAYKLTSKEFDSEKIGLLQQKKEIEEELQTYKNEEEKLHAKIEALEKQVETQKTAMKQLETAHNTAIKKLETAHKSAMKQLEKEHEKEITKQAQNSDVMTAIEELKQQLEEAKNEEEK